MLRRPANLVAALLLAVALSDDSLPAGFWENSGGSTGTAAKIKANVLPSDYTYSYSEAPLPPPPEPPPPPPPLPPPFFFLLRDFVFPPPAFIAAGSPGMWEAGRILGM